MTDAKKDGMPKTERAIVIAKQIELLFGFCANLIPDKDLLKEVMNKANTNVGRTMAMAPVIGAFGMDSEVAEFAARLKADRSQALFNLIDVLDRTEKERAEFAKKQAAKEKGRGDLRILGL